MDFNDTPEQAEFRKTCRKWLEDNAKLKSGNQVEDFANIDYLQAGKDWSLNGVKIKLTCHLLEKLT